MIIAYNFLVDNNKLKNQKERNKTMNKPTNTTRYINTKTDFSKFSKAQLAAMMERVMWFMQNYRNMQISFELASYLNEELPQEYGFLDAEFCKEYNENYFSAERNMLEACVSIRMAKQIREGFSDYAKQLEEEIRDLLK